MTQPSTGSSTHLIRERLWLKLALVVATLAAPALAVVVNYWLSQRAEAHDPVGREPPVTSTIVRPPSPTYTTTPTPPSGPTIPMAPIPGASYLVRPGDSLTSITAELVAPEERGLGVHKEWVMAVYLANPIIVDIDHIEPGWVLAIPHGPDNGRSRAS